MCKRRPHQSRPHRFVRLRSLKPRPPQSRQSRFSGRERRRKSIATDKRSLSNAVDPSQNPDHPKACIFKNRIKAPPNAMQLGFVSAIFGDLELKEVFGHAARPGIRLRRGHVPGPPAAPTGSNGGVCHLDDCTDFTQAQAGRRTRAGRIGRRRILRNSAITRSRSRQKRIKQKPRSNISAA